MLVVPSIMMANANALVLVIQLVVSSAAPIKGTKRQLASVGGVKREVTCPLSTVELADGRCSTHLATPQPQPELVNCTWYKSSSCCSADDTLRLSHADPEIRLQSASRGCRDTLTMLQCAACSPEQEVVSTRNMIRRPSLGHPKPISRVRLPP